MSVIGIDLITSYYAARSQQRLAASGAGLATSASALGTSSSAAAAGLPPWDVRLPQPSAEERLRDALGGGSFLGTVENPNGEGGDERKLFNLYNALTKLSAIAAHAGDKKTSDSLLGGLDKRFGAALDEITAYASKLTSDRLAVVPGSKETKADTDLNIPRGLSQYTTKIVHRDVTTNALAGLDGTESFTIAVKKGGQTINVAIDLSELGTSEIKLDDLITFMNGKLADAGIVTKFKRERVITLDENGKEPSPLPQTWALKIEGTATEVLSFSAANAGTAVYLAGISGKPGETAGQVLKLDASGTEPSLIASARIEPEESTANAASGVLDSQGNFYVVGNSNGSFGNQINQADGEDVYLTKYDSNGKLVWTRLLGTSETASGFAVAVDGDDNVVVAGKATGSLTGATTASSNATAFVSKYSRTGAELFTRHTGPFVEDGALALTTGADGSIYVGGYTKGSIGSGLTHGGGEDGFITKLSSTGTLVYNRQIGTSGAERITGLAVDGSGDLIALSKESGRAVVRKFSSADGTSAAVWERDLGDLAGGEAAAVTVDGSSVYVGGSTQSGSIGAGTVLGSYQGGSDGFVAAINLASGAVDSTTFVGTGSTDRIKSIAVKNGEVYVAGDTTGDLGGGFLGTVNGFAAKLDGSGGLSWVHQYAGRNGQAKAVAIGVDLTGASVLDVLGLPKGQLDYSQSRTIPSQTTVRAGQEFSISVNGGAARRIKIDDDETLRSLTFKINSILLLDGKAQVRRVSGGDSLRIEPRDDTRIDLIAGRDGRDALAGLGLEAGTLVKGGSLFGVDTSEDGKEADDGPLYLGLGLSSSLSVRTRDEALEANEIIQKALTDIRAAYRDLTKDPRLDALLKQQKKATGPVPAYLSAQLANYSDGLRRLIGEA